MKNLLLGALLASAMLSAPIEAKKSALGDIDFGQISCTDFLSDVETASEDDIGAVLIWLDGYLSGLTGDTVMRPDGLEAFAENLVLRCQRRGREPLLDAARAVGIE